MSKQEYIERLQLVIHQLHGCDAKHIETVPVHEQFNGKTVWQGEVEVFSVNHPKTSRAYAWSHKHGPDDLDERFVAVLGLPPVRTPADAVRASIVAESRST